MHWVEYLPSHPDTELFHCPLQIPSCSPFVANLHPLILDNHWYILCPTVCLSLHVNLNGWSSMYGAFWVWRNTHSLLKKKICFENLFTEVTKIIQTGLGYTLAQFHQILYKYSLSQNLDIDTGTMLYRSMVFYHMCRSV